MDNVPRPVSGGLVYVYTQPTTGITAPIWNGSAFVGGTWSTAAASLATIYWDNAGSDQLPNPFPLDGNGNGWFYAVGGLYTVVIDGGTLASPTILVDQNLILAASGGALFQTNGVSNSSQTLLNLLQGSNITITNTSGNTTISGTAAAITLQVNSSAASSQTFQNLIAGGGITITDGGGGAITFAATAAATYQVNGTPTSSQSVINFINGTNTTVTNPSAGNISIASAYPVFQTNSVNITDQTTINFVDSGDVSFSNPSGNMIEATLVNPGSLLAASVQIASAAIKTLRATPVQILPLAGANTQYKIVNVTFEFEPVTTAYSTVSTADLAVYVDTTKATLFTGDSTGLIDQTAKTYEDLYASANKIFTTEAHSTNQAMFVANVSGAEYTLGDGTLTVNVWYEVLATV